jgi:dynein heavy chain
LYFQQPWLLEAESSVEACLEVLKDLNERMTYCVNLANEYNLNQKIFKLEVSRFEILEQVVSDVKLRMLLWDSLDVWDKSVSEWYVADFNTLSVEDINAFVLKNVKNIIQIEKGLIPNNILLALKGIKFRLKEKICLLGR